MVFGLKGIRLLPVSISMMHLPTRSTLFPYTTLFRSMKPSILLVDDFEDGLEMYEEYLTYRGFPVIVDRKSTRLNSSHSQISYAVFCLKKKSGSVVDVFCGAGGLTHGLRLEGYSVAAGIYFNDASPYEIYPLSLHDALPIYETVDTSRR